MSVVVVVTSWNLSNEGISEKLRVLAYNGCRLIAEGARVQPLSGKQQVTATGSFTTLGSPSPWLCRSFHWQNVSYRIVHLLRVDRSVSNEDVDFKCYHWEIENSFCDTWPTGNCRYRQWQQLRQQRAWKLYQTERDPSYQNRALISPST